MANAIIKKYLNDYFFNDYTPILIIVAYHFVCFHAIGKDFIYKEFFVIFGIIQAVIFEISLLNKSDKTVYYGNGKFNYFIKQIFVSIFFIILTFTLDYYIIYIENVSSFRFTVSQPNLSANHIFSLPLFVDFFYFSITTFSTTGYGDIQPFSNLARLFSVVQLTISFFIAYYVLNYYSDNLENSKKLITSLLSDKEPSNNNKNQDKNDNILKLLIPLFITFVLMVALFYILRKYFSQTPLMIIIEKLLVTILMLTILVGIFDFLIRIINWLIKDIKMNLPILLPSKVLLYFYGANLFILSASYFVFGNTVGNYVVIASAIAIPVIYYQSIKLRLFINSKDNIIVLSVIFSLIPYIISYGIVLFLFSYKNPHSFNVQSPNPEHSIIRLADFLYYSVITFSTTGYGDIFPVSTFAKCIISIKLISNLFLIFYFVSNILNIAPNKS